MPAKKRKLDEAPPAEKPEAGAGLSVGRGRVGDDAGTPRRSLFAAEMAARSRSSATATIDGDSPVWAAVTVVEGDDPAAP